MRHCLRLLVPTVLIIFVVVVVTAIHEIPVQAFLPINCSPEHARADYDEAGAVVIGRVVKIERVRTVERSEKGGDEIIFAYWATIKIGRALKGPVEVGDDIMMFLGNYTQFKEDNSVPTHAATCNTHAPHALKFNAVYLLFANRWRPPKESLEKEAVLVASGELVPDQRTLAIFDHIRNGGVWRPRSCHFSVHELFFRYGKGNAKALCVRPGCWGGWKLGEFERPEALPLDEFLEMKKRQGEQACKKAKRN